MELRLPMQTQPIITLTIKDRKSQGMELGLPIEIQPIPQITLALQKQSRWIF